MGTAENETPSSSENNSIQIIIISLFSETKRKKSNSVCVEQTDWNRKNKI